MNEKTANEKHWHLFVRKKIFLHKEFPITDDKSVIICQQVNIFKWSFATLCLKDRNLKSENFKLLAWVKKKLLKKIWQRVNFIPPHPMHSRVKCVKQSAVSDHLLECNCLIDFDHFDILASDANRFRLLIKESLLIKRDQPQLSKTFKSFLLKLFDWDLCW